jgi:hypothetical protein
MLLFQEGIVAQFLLRVNCVRSSADEPKKRGPHALQASMSLIIYIELFGRFCSGFFGPFAFFGLGLLISGNSHPRVAKVGRIKPILLLR